ncbi:MAG: FtsQ-type POTRA domain-containing protein [Sphaerochaetaceae bacterium]|nr:FtsQ-type POTRA domain-containing protein [Sphaerochaetaceae bacterium]
MMRKPLLDLVCFIVLLVFILFALPHIPIFEISDIRVVGVDRVPASVVEILKPLYGENRFGINLGKIEKKIEALPGISKAKLRHKLPTILIVELEIKENSSLLYDSENYYLLYKNKLEKINNMDVESLSEKYCVTEITPSFRRYIEKYGATPEFVEILSLIDELRSEKGNLITRVVYLDSSTTPYGQLKLELGSLFSTIFVRERVSKNRISDSIKVIEKEVGTDPASIIARKTVNYDLYRDALVRRNVGSV